MVGRFLLTSVLAWWRISFVESAGVVEGFLLTSVLDEGSDDGSIRSATPFPTSCDGFLGTQANSQATFADVFHNLS